MTEQQKNGVTFLAAEIFTAAGGVAHGFSTRWGGVSGGIYASLNLGTNRGDDPDRVRENYRRFCAATGTDLSGVVMTRQVHGTGIRSVAPGDAMGDVCGPVEMECDGLVTNAPGLALTVFSADCPCVLLYDPMARVIAAVHSGWRGTAGNIAGKAVETMGREYGCAPERILAAVGPCISRCCFETHADVPEAMTAALGELARPHIYPDGDGKFHVDLKGILAAELTRVGLTPAHIEISQDCTACRPDKYWSHRRAGDRRGSQAAMIQLL